jgi:hypothetical protein
MWLAERSIGRMLNIACVAPPKHTTDNRQQDDQSDGKFPTEKQHANRPYETGYGTSPTKRSCADRPYETGYGTSPTKRSRADRSYETGYGTSPKRSRADRPYETGYGTSPTKRSRADRPYKTGSGKANEQAGSAIRCRHSCRTRVSNRVAQAGTPSNMPAGSRAKRVSN